MRVAYDYYGYEGDFFYDYADYETDPNADPWIVKNYDGTTAHWMTANLQWSGNLGARHRLVTGGEFRYHIERYQTNRDLGDAAWTYFESDEPGSEFAVFAQDEFTLTDWARLNAGIRHDRYTRFESTNPRLALIVSPRERTTLKAIYGTAFRAPNAYEMFYGDGVWQGGNPDLMPEEMETLEFVAEQRFGSRLTAVASYFDYHLDDMIYQSVDTNDVLVFVNGAPVQAKGIELALDARMWSGINGRLSYSRADAESEADGTRLVNSPEHIYKANVVFPLRQTDSTLGLEYQYLSERTTLLGGTADAHGLVNASLRHSFGMSGVTAMASVFNVFDEEYGDPGFNEHLQELLPREGRVLRLEVGHHW